VVVVPPGQEGLGDLHGGIIKDPSGFGNHWGIWSVNRAFVKQNIVVEYLHIPPGSFGERVRGRPKGRLLCF
jgi:hypothetical protein